MPGRVIGFLKIEENTQDKLTVSESCRDIMFQTEKRVSGGTKPPKTELKGRELTEGFEDPNEAVGDNPLQYLEETSKQRDGPEVARVGMGLPGLWDGDDHRLKPTVREGT